MSINSEYRLISEKINDMKKHYRSLKDKTEDFVFSAVCIKYSIYKNPSLILNESDLEDSIVDGTNDGGADFILIDPNSDGASDLIIGQSKYKNTISKEEAKNAIHKMIDFYDQMIKRDYSTIRNDVINKFSRSYAEIGDESKIIFALYTSSPQNSIRTDSLKKILKERFEEEDKYELRVFFGSDIVNEIKEADSRRPYIENGILKLDTSKNFLEYGENAAIVNISAKSLQDLYGINGINLLSMNLRYFTKKQDLDFEIKKTMKENPDSFWYRNNGITIICEDYNIDGVELKLKNFSIINGGQTTYLVFKHLPQDTDFFIACKVITSQGNSQEEKDQFILDIAKATNSQKAIKDTDLKANAPEQLAFGRAIREKEVFYKTKRGETIPSNYKVEYKHTDYPAVGKLYLAGIYLLPGKSRNKPSIMKDSKYYNPIYKPEGSGIFNSCGIIKDLLYVDYYFRKVFINQYQKNAIPNRISFANNSRTLCIAFIGLSARLCQDNLDSDKFYNAIQNGVEDSTYEEKIYPLLKKFDKMTYIFNPSHEKNMDTIDSCLSSLFSALIKQGYKLFETQKEKDQSLIETNYLKKDSSFFKIVSWAWDDLIEEIEKNRHIFR